MLDQKSFSLNLYFISYCFGQMVCWYFSGYLGKRDRKFGMGKLGVKRGKMSFKNGLKEGC